MGQHSQKDLLLGQERQVLKGKSRQGSASRRKATAAPPPAPEPYSPARARTRAPRELMPRAPGTRPAAPWTGDCPSLPSPRCAHSFTNSPRDSGNFLTSVLGAASPPRPVPSPQQPLLGLRPRARPCVQCPGTLRTAQLFRSRLPAGPGELEAGPGGGAGRAGAEPRPHGTASWWAGQSAPCARGADCACVGATTSLVAFLRMHLCAERGDASASPKAGVGDLCPGWSG